LSSQSTGQGQSINWWSKPAEASSQSARGRSCAVNTDPCLSFLCFGGGSSRAFALPRNFHGNRTILAAWECFSTGSLPRTLQRAPPHAQRHRFQEEGADDHARTHPTIAAGIPCLLLHPTLIATTTGAAHDTHDIHTPCRSSRPKYTPPLRTCCEASNRPTMCSAPPPSSS
jgi:hypothetical protein